MLNQSSTIIDNVQKAVEEEGAVVTGRDDMQFGSLLWFVQDGVEYSMFVGKRTFKKWPKQSTAMDA